ncbi:MAG: threonine synthase, partial [Helicobacteraceae bacterium]|nr:threonine synthase [Helicobacteraceae bacterium]
MFAIYLECSKCGEKVDRGQKAQLCPKCAAPLLVRYDLDKVKAAFCPKKLSDRPYNLWRYAELLPIENEANVVSLGEVVTPLIALNKLGARLGFEALLLKDEGLNQGGTFKSRGAALGVSRAKELGVREFAMPTNGNAGAAWALYGAKAGIKAYIVMPKDAPYITRLECAIAGADLYLVDGLISDAGRIIGKAIAKNGWYDASTLKEPYRIEGKKTMALEIVEQLGWQTPDVILYPTGGGVGLIGIYKALLELMAIGVIKTLPRLVAVQSSGCDPIVRAYEAGKKISEFRDNSRTIAFGINVPKPIGDFLILEALEKSNGTAIAVSDAAILRAQSELACAEGLFVCPEGAATLAAAYELLRRGWIKPNEKVVLLNTGNGLKYP